MTADERFTLRKLLKASDTTPLERVPWAEVIELHDKYLKEREAERG